MADSGRDEQLEAMQATIDELRARVDAFGATALVDEPAVSRRHALRAAGVLAAGAMAGGLGMVAGATPAAAFTPGGFASNDGSTPAVAASGTNGSIGVWASSDSAVAVSGDSAGSHGIYGTSTSSQHCGVAGYNPNGIGLFGSGLRGLYASGSESNIRFSPVATRTASPYMGDLAFDTNGDMWMCCGLSYSTSPPTPLWRKLAGPATSGSFHPVTPGRVYDSRVASGGAGPLNRGESRTVSVANRIANGPTPALSAFVPAGAIAVTVNLTITGTVGASGNLAVNPGGDTLAHASSINWFGPGQTLANSTVVQVDASTRVTVICNGPVGASTNFIIDVLGYWL